MKNLRLAVTAAPAPLVLLALALLTQSAPAAIINGDFETGDFTGWTRSAFLRASGGPTSGGPAYATFLAAQSGSSAVTDSNAVESSQSTWFDPNGVAGPAIAPNVGSFMAFISNEKIGGDNTMTGSSIAQTFAVPAGATTLSFAVRLLNNDISTSFATFDDFGGVALTQGATVLAQYNLDLNPATAANAHVTVGTNVGGFKNSTAWLTSSFNVAALAGQNVTLTAYSAQYGADNYVETRLLLDHIVIPEPAAPTLTAIVGIAALLGVRRSSPRRPRYN